MLTKWNRNIEIKWQSLITIALALLVIPISLFLIFNIKLLLALPLIAILLFISYKITKVNKKVFTISIKDLCFICLFAIIVIWLSGIGAAFPQSSDWHKHNAIIHDLIFMDWPIQYDNGLYLNYYFVFYLIPVTIAKIFILLGCTYSIANIVFNISNFIYCCTILILVFFY